MQMIFEALISVSAHLCTHKLYKREMERRNEQWEGDIGVP